MTNTNRLTHLAAAINAEHDAATPPLFRSAMLA